MNGAGRRGLSMFKKFRRPGGLPELWPPDHPMREVPPPHRRVRLSETANSRSSWRDSPKVNTVSIQRTWLHCMNSLFVCETIRRGRVVYCKSAATLTARAVWAPITPSGLPGRWKSKHSWRLPWPRSRYPCD